MIRLLAILCLACALVSCGKSSDDSGGAFSDGYQFNDNGCDTKEHKFTSSNESEVKRQICYALRDGELNGYCAQQERQALFDTKCGEYAWNP